MIYWRKAGFEHEPLDYIGITFICDARYIRTKIDIEDFIIEYNRVFEWFQANRGPHDKMEKLSGGTILVWFKQADKAALFKLTFFS